MWTVLDLGESVATGPLDPNSSATSKKENKPQETVQGLKLRNMRVNQELNGAILNFYDRRFNNKVTTLF